MTVARAARMDGTGGPEVIEWADVDLPPPPTDEVRMRNTAVGLNFIDTYFRSGLYPSDLPSGLGSEAVGVIEAVGEGVTGFTVGDRVGTFGPARGAYATARNLPAATLVKLPEDIDDRTAAAVLLKGCTAECLADRCAQVSAGETALVWAAAGGVGHLLVGWLKARGVTVIGVVGSQAKAAQAEAAGADTVIVHTAGDVAKRVRDVTGGAGARYVFDGVGQASWAASLASTARRGLIVSFGNAGGAVTGVALGTLSASGSLFVTRPTLYDYYREPAERQAGFDSVFAMLRSGAIRAEVGQTFALEDAAEAHRALEAGETFGSSILIPDTAAP